MIIHREIIQGSPEWDEIRKGKMTGSHATAIAACGKGLDTYIADIILAMIAPTEHFMSWDMKRGKELEPIARAAYEFETGQFIEEVGFITYNNFVGVSPDALVGVDGGLEIKARNNKIHFALLRGGKIDTGTLNQIQMNLLCSGRKWWDFGSYNPNFKKSLFKKRIYPDLDYFKKLEKGFKKGEGMLKEMTAEQAVEFELLKVA